VSFIDITPYLPALLAAIASFVGAWLAAQFALRRFYREKMWERKAAAYTTIFEALHQMYGRFDVEYHAELVGRPLTPKEKKELGTKYREIKDNMYKTVAGQTWVISRQSSALLLKLDNELGRPRESELDLYSNGLVAVHDTTEQLKQLAKADLEF
jgi:hypothetical protein